jgi:hypothetical protein
MNTPTPTPTTVNDMNTALYNASVCLMEVYKHLSAVPEFHKEAGVFLLTARRMVDVIVPEDAKISVDKMQDILSEILGLPTRDAVK